MISPEYRPSVVMLKSCLVRLAEYKLCKPDRVVWFICFYVIIQPSLGIEQTVQCNIDTAPFPYIVHIGLLDGCSTNSC